MTEQYTPSSRPGRSGPRLLQVAADRLKRVRARFDAEFQRMDPVHVVAFGYGLYVMLGFIALSTPWAQTAPVAALDRFFMAASAVTTTGLATHDPGGTYTFMLIGRIGILAVGIALATRDPRTDDPDDADLVL